MTSEISVERQFHFHCSCGAITITGERTVICTGCGVTLGVCRVRRHRQRSDTVTYYGRNILVRRVKKRVQRSNTAAAFAAANPGIWFRFSAWGRRALDRLALLLEESELHQTRDEPHELPVTRDQPRGPVSNKSPTRSLLEGVHVKVRPTRPDGSPHPHAGKTGRITRFMNTYTDPYWLGLPSAMIKLHAGIEPRGFIWVSLECLEALPDLMHSFPHECNDI
jgi:hypothetical protein